MKIHFVLLALLLAIAAPLPLAGQRDGGRDGGHDGKPHHHRIEQGAVEKLLRHRDALGLTGEQVARLQEIDQQLETRNEPHVQRLMALRREMKAQLHVEPKLSHEQRKAVFDRWSRDAKPSLDQIHQNNRAAMHEVGAVLTPEQKARVRQIIRGHGDRDGKSGDGDRRRDGGR